MSQTASYVYHFTTVTQANFLEGGDTHLTASGHVHLLVKTIMGRASVTSARYQQDLECVSYASGSTCHQRLVRSQHTVSAVLIVLV